MPTPVTTGDLISAADWNGLEKVIVKTAFEGVANSTVVQDDDHLFFAIGANEVWVFDMALFVGIGSETGDIKLTITGPASPNVARWGALGGLSTNTAGSGSGEFSAKDFGTEQNYMVDDIQLTLIYLTGFIDNGVNAGTVRLRWAQSVSSGVSSSLLQGSWLRPRQVL